jgi:tetratricopeptide (TPR) repeat protein
MSTLDHDRTIDQALEHHQQGRLADAEQLYRRVLADDPNHADALHFLGVIAHQVGRHADAVNLIGLALRQLQDGPPRADVLNNFAEALRMAGRVPDAVAALRQVVQIEPNYGEAWSNLGLALDTLGQLPDALTAHDRAVQLTPNLPNAHYNRGVTLEHMGRLDEAIDEFEDATKLQPNHLLALNNLGAALTRRGHAPRAITILRKACQINPNYIEGYINLTGALSAAEKFDDAIDVAKRAVQLDPNRAESLNNLGVALDKAKRYHEAVDAYQKAIGLKPNFGLAHGNLGSSYDKLGQSDDAVRCFERAAELIPNNPDVLATLSGVYRTAGRDAESVATADKAIALNPNHADAHGNRAFALLHAGDYLEGFREYEWRWRCKTFSSPVREFERPLWDGTDPAGRTILVHAEQGYGDVIQMARFIPMLADRGANVLVECVPVLRPLIETCRGVGKVVPTGLKLPDFDLHCPIMSLPRAFNVTIDTLPREVPYLHATDDRKQFWRGLIEPKAAGAKLKVGLVWGGNVKPDPRRSASLKAFEPLGEVPGVVFFSLQRDEPAAELKHPPQGIEVTDLGKDIKNFADSAAVLANLDLLITIDSAPAHLGGATGTRTWTLLPVVADWRWLRSREDSPWYPTMRLFRQEKRDDWGPVIDRMKEELKKLIAAGSGSM